MLSTIDSRGASDARDGIAPCAPGPAGSNTLPDATGSQPSVYATIPGISVGTATVVFTSRHNGAGARVTVSIAPHSVSAPTTLAAGGQLVLSTQKTNFLVQSDGNLVLRSFGSPRWTSDTTGHPGARLDLQTDANLVLRDAAGRAVWSTGTAGFGPGAQLTLGLDGNVVLYAANGRPLWSTTTIPNSEFYPYGFEITAGHALGKGALVTDYPDATTTLGVRADGNVVLVDPRGRLLWNTATGGHPNSYLSLQTDGNLVVRSATNVALWANTVRCGPGARLVLQVDGNLVERAANGVAVWSTHTLID